MSYDIITGRAYLSPYHIDCQMPLFGINPTGPAAAPTVDPAGEGWLFAGASTDNVAILVAQIDHDNVQGSTTISPHVHWRKTTAAAGNVTWRLEYKIAAPGESFGAFVQAGSDVSTPIAHTVDNNTAARHLITAFADITITVELSSIIIFKLTRVASATGTDTYNADCLAMSFDFHRIIDSPGSRQEYVK